MRSWWVVCVLLGVSAPATSAESYCTGGLMPPRELIVREPTVVYNVVFLSSDLMLEVCDTPDWPVSRAAFGCNANERRDEWWIYINNETQGLGEQFCTFWHEKAHLPPNNWQHPPPPDPSN